MREYKSEYAANESMAATVGLAYANAVHAKRFAPVAKTTVRRTVRDTSNDVYVYVYGMLALFAVPAIAVGIVQSLT